jgi:hypothetical protein
MWWNSPHVLNVSQCYYRCESHLITIANASQLEADMKLIAAFRESNKLTNTLGMRIDRTCGR